MCNINIIIMHADLLNEERLEIQHAHTFCLGVHERKRDGEREGVRERERERERGREREREREREI